MSTLSTIIDRLKEFAASSLTKASAYETAVNTLTKQWSPQIAQALSLVSEAKSSGVPVPDEAITLLTTLNQSISAINTVGLVGAVTGLQNPVTKTLGTVYTADHIIASASGVTIASVETTTSAAVVKPVPVRTTITPKPVVISPSPSVGTTTQNTTVPGSGSGTVVESKTNTENPAAQPPVPAAAAQ